METNRKKRFIPVHLACLGSPNPCIKRKKRRPNDATVEDKALARLSSFWSMQPKPRCFYSALKSSRRWPNHQPNIQPWRQAGQPEEALIIGRLL
jgi:hypothetical protein